MGLPVKSIGLACRSLRSASYASGPTRTIRSSLTTPTAMWPRTMKAIPPNIVFSETSDRSSRTPRMRSASPASYAIVCSSRVGDHHGVPIRICDSELTSRCVERLRDGAGLHAGLQKLATEGRRVVAVHIEEDCPLGAVERLAGLGEHQVGPSAPEPYPARL